MKRRLRNCLRPEGTACAPQVSLRFLSPRYSARRSAGHRREGPLQMSSAAYKPADPETGSASWALGVQPQLHKAPKRGAGRGGAGGPRHRGPAHSLLCSKAASALTAHSRVLWGPAGPQAGKWRATQSHESPRSKKTGRRRARRSSRSAPTPPGGGLGGEGAGPAPATARSGTCAVADARPSPGGCTHHAHTHARTRKSFTS